MRVLRIFANKKEITTVIALVAIGLVAERQGCSALKTISGSKVREKYFSESDITVNGTLRVVELSTKSLTVNGSASIGPAQSVVRGALFVRGALDAHHLIVLDEAKIHESAAFTGSHLRRTLSVFGIAELESTTVDGPVIIAGKILLLKNDVLIKGPIEFLDKAGVVIIEGTNIQLLSGIVNGVAQRQGHNFTSTRPLYF